VLAHIEEGVVRQHRDWPTCSAAGLARLPADDAAWPWVEIVTSNAAATGDSVRALHAAGVRGIVVAGTGNASVHEALESALLSAQAGGVAVLRCTRCLDGVVIDADPDAAQMELPSAGTLTPVQARIELILRLLESS
jgi:L-asparaginase